MLNDLNSTFGEIFGNDYNIFKAQLLEIQQFQANRKDSERWAERLRFLDISNVPHLTSTTQERPSKRLRGPSGIETSQTTHKPLLAIPIVEKDIESSQYIAVSWRWPLDDESYSPYCFEVDKSFNYHVQRPGEEPHKSDFSDYHLERVIKFAQSVDISNIWIDKESIYQRSGDETRYNGDRDCGVQIMDVIYGWSTLSIALMTIEPLNQDEVDTLGALLSRTIFVEPKDTETPRLIPLVNREDVQDVILRILKDPRWSRGWIFQEDHLSSDRMTLLIHHFRHVTKDPKYDFGSIPCELQVDLVDFKQAVTMFCLTYNGGQRILIGIQWPMSEMLAKAKQYNIWNKETREMNVQLGKEPLLHGSNNEQVRDIANKTESFELNDPKASVYPSMTLSILHEITKRNLLKEEDRIAIQANACRFDVRLDISPTSPLLKSQTYSLSVTLLALVLLNGEILLNNIDISKDAMMQFTLSSYLERCQYKFNAPTSRLAQSFINHCRLSACKLTEDGLEVIGHLFKVQESTPNGEIHPLGLTKRDLKDLCTLRQERSNKRARPNRKIDERLLEAARILTSRLRDMYGEDCTLANDIEELIVLDERGATSQGWSASTRYRLDMLAAVLHALLEEQDVRLAFRDDPIPPSPCGIFILPALRNSWWVGATTRLSPVIFASWSGGSGRSDMDRLTSFSVNSPSDTEGGSRNPISVKHAKVLKSDGWVNGIWKATKESQRTFVLHLPGISNH